MAFGLQVEQAPVTIQSRLDAHIRESLPYSGDSGRMDCPLAPFRSMIAEPETLPGLAYRNLDKALSKMENEMREMVASRQENLDREVAIKFRLGQPGVPVTEKDGLNSELREVTSTLNDLRRGISQLNDRYNSRLQEAFGTSTTKPEKDTFLYMVERIVKEFRKEIRLDEILEFKAEHGVMALEDLVQIDPTVWHLQNTSFRVLVIRRKKTKKFAGRTRATSGWRAAAESENDDEFFTKEESGPVGGTLTSTIKD